MNSLLLAGVAMFFAGTATFFGVLFASGGVQNSKQFAVLGQLWSGKLGAARRAISLGSLALAVLGGLTCMAGVVANDVQRARNCEQYCLAEGYTAGKIGASIDQSPTGRFVACTCTAPDKEPLERRAGMMTGPSESALAPRKP